MNERLKILRNSLQLSQRAFCEKIGLKQSTYAAFETGERELKESYIKLICHEYNVNEDWLKFGIGDIFISITSKNINEVINILESLSPELQEYAINQIKELSKIQDIIRK